MALYLQALFELWCILWQIYRFQSRSVHRKGRRRTSASPQWCFRQQSKTLQLYRLLWRCWPANSRQIRVSWLALPGHSKPELCYPGYCVGGRCTPSALSAPPQWLRGPRVPGYADKVCLRVDPQASRKEVLGVLPTSFKSP